MAQRFTCTWPQAVLSGALAAVLALHLGAVANADELDDKKEQLEQQIDGLQTDLEFLDADIQKTAAKLQGYQAQLPGAQQALAEAEGRVQSASNEVAALAQRVSAAEQTRDDLNRQLEEDQEQIDQTREMIGQIATQAYKRGGVSTDLSLILGAGNGGDLAEGLDLAGQALRSQNAVLTELTQRAATDRNAQARMVAVEQEIKDLKAEADAALAREQQARDDAAAKKREVDSLISQAAALSQELEAKKPQIQAQIQASQSEHEQVVADIAERQERLRREAEERRRKAAEEAARKKREAEEAARAAEEARARAAADAAAKQREAERKQREAAEAEVSAQSAGGGAPSSSTSSWGLQSPAPAGAYITSRFGWRPTPAGTIDYGGAGGYLHAGVDWGVGGACGSPVYAAADGEVWFSGWGGSSGNKVTLNHGVVRGNALATNYHHLSSRAVGVGQNVKRGQVIGYVGTTGNSTGCHLHFETILNGQAVNPLGLL